MENSVEQTPRITEDLFSSCFDTPSTDLSSTPVVEQSMPRVPVAETCSTTEGSNEEPATDTISHRKMKESEGSNTSYTHSSPNTSTEEEGDSTGSLHAEEEEWKQLESTTRHNVSCEGDLKRRMIFGNWKKRYFLLSDGRLFEFRDKTSDKPSAVYPLKLCSIATAGDMVNRDNVIAINSPGKDPLMLQAPDKSTMMMWMDAMKLISTMVDNPGKTIQTSTSPTVIADRNGRILDVNDAMEKLFGYRREELIGGKVTMLMFDNVAKYHSQYMKNYLKTGDRKLIGKPRNFVAKHKFEYEIPITLVMGEFIDKGKRHFIAVFKDLRSIGNDLSLTHNIESVKSRISTALEKELINFSNTFRDSDVKRRELERENQKCRRELEVLSKTEEELKYKVQELEKVIALGRINSTPLNISPRSQQRLHRSTEGTKRIERSKEGVFIDFSNVTAIEKISDGHGVGADIYQCNVDGFQCAMKIISTKNCSEKKLKYLLSEIEILESLPYHPNICRYLFHDIQGDSVRLFMTKYSGSLQWKIEQLYEQKECFSSKEIAEIAVFVLNALIFLHDHDICHRDLKADNVFCMFNENDKVVNAALGDFDSARLAGGEKIMKTVIGTPAPEVLQATDDNKYDKSIDMYSFGMLLYEMLTLHRPYHDVQAISQISKMILKGIKPRLGVLPDDYKVLADLHNLCISSNPAGRPSAKIAKAGLLEAYW